MKTRSCIALVGPLVFAGFLLAPAQRSAAQCCAPAITSQPTNQTCSVGTNVTFRVELFSSTYTTFQWRFNGTNINAATGSNYTILNVQSTNAGSYSVAITNTEGYAISSNAV